MFQNAIRLSKQVSKEAIKWRADPVRMNNLRMNFVEQCKQYFGVPYAKKYQQPGSKISTCFYSNDVHAGADPGFS